MRSFFWPRWLLAALVTGAVLTGLQVLRGTHHVLDGGTIAGRARILDGDSIVVDGIEIRLKGIDAPELHQTCTKGGIEHPCGRLARAHIAALIAGAGVTCHAAGSDRYGRALAVCGTNTVPDLNAAMVRDGWAFSYGDYLIDETRARLAGRGVWSFRIDLPSEWRRTHPRP